MDTYQTLRGTQLQQIDNKNYFSILPDGRRLQLTQMLFYLLNELQTPLNIQQIRIRLHEDLGLETEQSELVDLLDNVLVNQGLLRKNGAVVRENLVVPETPISSPGITDLHLQINLLSKTQLQPLTAILQVFFHAPIAFLLMIVIVATQISVLRELNALHDINIQIRYLPTVLLFLIASTIFHELGHLSACQKGGAEHGAMGIGLYFFTPVFFADVTEAWNLPQMKRIIVNLGGIYFQLLLTPILLALFIASDNILYLWMILGTYWLIVINLNPVIKLDGYWIVSDTLKIPNLHKRSAELITFTFNWLVRKMRRASNTTSCPPFLAKLSPHQTFGLTCYATLAMLLVAVAMRFAFPVVIDQLNIAHLVIDALIQRYPAISWPILREAGLFLIMPLFIVITLIVVIYRLIGTIHSTIGVVKS